MLKIRGCKTSFFQWDYDQYLEIKNERCTEIHFSNDLVKWSEPVEIDKENNLVKVPNVLLTMPANLKAYVYDTDHTIRVYTFPVIKKNKPVDYVFTEEEVGQYNKIKKQLEDVSNLLDILQSDENTEGSINNTIKTALDSITVIPDDKIQELWAVTDDN